MRDAIDEYPQLQVLSSITNYWDLETHILDLIGPTVKSVGAYSFTEFLIVAYWKSARQLTSYRQNDGEGRVARVTQRAFSGDVLDDGKSAALCKLAGVGVPVASALLTAWNPDRFSIIDVRALHTLSAMHETVDGIWFEHHAPQWWKNHYNLYMQACRSIQHRVAPLSLRDVDRALWKWSQFNAAK